MAEARLRFRLSCMILEKTSVSLSISLDLYNKRIMTKKDLRGPGDAQKGFKSLMRGKEKGVTGDSGLAFLCQTNTGALLPLLFWASL